jgi:hypothetical protein
MDISDKTSFGGKTLLRWKAPEFEAPEMDNRLYAYVFLPLIAIVGYAIYQNSLVVAITFILIGVIIYLQLHKEPQVIDFAVTADGVAAGNELFEYENIKSFWIFYDPPHEKHLSLHTRGHLLPFVHIPLESQNPVELRETLSEYVPEVKQNHGFVDALERFLRI